MSNRKNIVHWILCFFALAVVAAGIAMYIWTKMPENAIKSTATAYRVTVVYIEPIIVAALLFFKAYTQKDIAVKTCIVTDAVCIAAAVCEFVFAAVKLGGMSAYLRVADWFPMLMMLLTVFLISLCCDFVRLGREKLPESKK